MVSELEVHEALAGLNDSLRLAQCSLVMSFPQIAAIGPLRQRAQRLRALLLEAIEGLSPVRPMPFGSVESRSCDVLTLRYIERSPVVELAEELSLSRRQVHRDLRQAEKRLTELLAAWAAPTEPASEVTAEPSTGHPSEELAVFSQHPTLVQLASALPEVVALVQPLADQLGVGIRLPQGSDMPEVLVDRAFLNQALVHVLSLAVQFCQHGDVRLDVEPSADGARVRVRLNTPRTSDLEARLEPATRLAAPQVGVSFTGANDAGEVAIALDIHSLRPLRVLVVEDNAGTVELYRRFLAGGNWQVQAAPDPRAAYDLTRTQKPDVVVLDLMMPFVDGWTVLRTLKSNPETAGVPVLVCSVVNDPALAVALGAVACLPKPVSRADLLLALNRCLETRSRHQPV
jgi:CheY-like chemotaxis protein